MIRHILGIAWHLGGMFILPFVLGFVAALFFEVSEVAETMPILIGISLLLLAPSFFCQVIGLLLRVRREWRTLRERDRWDAEAALASVHRHARIITPRGWALLITSLSFVVCALGLKWASLSVVATMGLLLFYGVVGITSLVSTLLTGTFQAGLARRSSIERGMVPAVILAGEPAEERFTFRRIPVPPGYYLLIEDSLPARLGTQSRYAVGAGAKREELVVGGRLRHTPRGLYTLGPAEVYYQDIFGLSRIAVASVATAELKVLPRFRTIHITEPPRSRAEAPDLLTRPHRFATEDHFRFREYLPGDDTRRISWKLSMRAGRVQLRQPESKEVSSRTVILALDTYLPRGRLLADAVGVEEVLDRLVEVWISLARDLVERGDKVTLVAMARQPSGVLGAESIRAVRGGLARWQDIGARVVWQGASDIGAMLDQAGADAHAVVISSRFQAPPPAPYAGESLTWVWMPPADALGLKDPTLLQVLAGSEANAASYLLRLPHVAGADENGFFEQLKTVRYHAGRLAARQRLRVEARNHGEAVFRALIARGDAVYRLDAGVTSHRLVGVSAGRGSLGAA
jgi:uncharacterized protein (DUF58 family)